MHGESVNQNISIAVTDYYIESGRAVITEAGVASSWSICSVLRGMHNDFGSISIAVSPIRSVSG